MEILEAILKYLKIDKAKIECLQTYYKKNKKLVIGVATIFVFLLLRYLGKELLLIFVPILVSFMITLLLRHWDKKDNNARNIRAELREYFLTNIKPLLDEIVKETYQKRTKYIDLASTTHTPKDIEKLQEYFIYQLNLVREIHVKVIPLLTFTENISHKIYIKRFKIYIYITQHMLKLYDKLISPQILDSKELYESVTLNQKQKQDLLHVIVILIDNIDFILAESELTLFNFYFDKDDIVFEKHIEILNECVLNTGLDPNKKIMCSIEEFEKIWNNKTIETK